LHDLLYLTSHIHLLAPYLGAALIGQQITITATFDEEILAVPSTQIGLSGEQSNFPANMTRSSGTVYTYTHTIAPGNGDVIIAVIRRQGSGRC
jgi:hypothetical protein